MAADDSGQVKNQIFHHIPKIAGPHSAQGLDPRAAYGEKKLAELRTDPKRQRIKGVRRTAGPTESVKPVKEYAMATRKWSGRPVRIWGVEITVRPGDNPPVAGEAVEVTASNGKMWDAPVLAVHTHNPKSGRCVIITPTKKDNPTADA